LLLPPITFCYTSLIPAVFSTSSTGHV